MEMVVSVTFGAELGHGKVLRIGRDKETALQALHEAESLPGNFRHLLEEALEELVVTHNVCTRQSEGLYHARVYCEGDEEAVPVAQLSGCLPGAPLPGVLACHVSALPKPSVEGSLLLGGWHFTW